MPPSRPLAERFWEKVDKTDTCWVWMASADRKGYGQFNIGKGKDRGTRMRRAHRVAYELVLEPPPQGLDLDHLCRNILCVNPEHLEPVTHQENVRRGRAGYHKGNVRTHCRKGGHLLAEHAHVRPDGSRYCKTCQDDKGRTR